MRYLIIAILCISCTREFKDSRFTYCYKWREGQSHWSCNNFVIRAEDWPMDSLKIKSHLDKKIKSQLSDTSLFESKIDFLYRERICRTQNLRYE